MPIDHDLIVHLHWRHCCSSFADCLGPLGRLPMMNRRVSCVVSRAIHLDVTVSDSSDSPMIVLIHEIHDAHSTAS